VAYASAATIVGYDPTIGSVVVASFRRRLTWCDGGKEEVEESATLTVSHDSTSASRFRDWISIGFVSGCDPDHPPFPSTTNAHTSRQPFVHIDMTRIVRLP
jgi:hypothetical protein